MSLRRIETRGGYLPIADHGLIGDGRTAALVGRNGGISWLCLPRFDAPPLFAALLDRHQGGVFSLCPEQLQAASQRYLGSSAILLTEMAASEGNLELTDAFLLRSGADLTEAAPATRSELLRSARVRQGRVRLRLRLQPAGPFHAEPRAGGLLIRTEQQPELPLQLWCSRQLESLDTTIDLKEGERLDLILRWEGTHFRRQVDPDLLLEKTADAWQRWVDRIGYQGPHAGQVQRSALTLKLLDYFENGAIVAAPTSSLPEAIGGPRNWDYRYAWIRDAAFSVYALRRIGLQSEADGFLGWVLDLIETGQRPRVLYTISGGAPAAERQDPRLEGYRASAPVRWGNGAFEQRQHDVYGEIIDCAYQWARGGGALPEELWRRLRALADAAWREWRQPDHGIWEVRAPLGRVFTYSAALCQVALDRTARLADGRGAADQVATWRSEAETIRRAILEEAWCERRGALAESLGGEALDASLLALPLRRVLEATHPRMVATVEAIRSQLGAGQDLLYRYDPELSPDGLPGHEGAFLICSFWLVDNLVMQGRLEEGLELFGRLCSLGNELGLLPEQIDPGDHSFLGNFPQAFSHVGLISSAVGLARALCRRDQPE